MPEEPKILYKIFICMTKDTPLEAFERVKVEIGNLFLTDKVRKMLNPYAPLRILIESVRVKGDMQEFIRKELKTPDYIS